MVQYSGVTAVGNGGVFKSVDGGSRWRRVGLKGRIVRSLRGSTSASVVALAADPGDPAVLYAAVGNDGVFKSADGGGRWRRVGLKGRSARSLLVDPVDSSVLYAGTRDRGVYRSTGGGDRWRRLGGRTDLDVVNALVKSEGKVHAAAYDGVFTFE